MFISDDSHTTYVPEMNEGDTYKNSIVIDKERQHLYTYDKDGKLIFHTPVSTGYNRGDKTKKGDWKTPVGKFNISRYEDYRDPKVFGAPYFWRLGGTGF
jgi:murein L,D-transpeptidase YafK